MNQDLDLARSRLITPRAAAIAGILFSLLLITTLVLAVFLLLSLGNLSWAPLVFPLWVLLISVHILFANLRRSRRHDEPSAARG